MSSGGENSWRAMVPPPSQCRSGSAIRIATAMWSNALPCASKHCRSVRGSACKYSRSPRARPRSETVGVRNP
eukprot:12680894-Alexandrium_andersonii.AAC.1